MRCQRSIDSSAHGAGDSTLIEARISGSWLEGQGTIFKIVRRKSQLCTRKWTLPVAFRGVAGLGYTPSTSISSLRKSSVLVMIIPLHIVFV